MIFEKRVTIVRIKKPEEKDLNISLQWFGNSLGLFNQRDKDKSCFRVFIELLKASKQHDPLSSDELAARLELTRGTVVHHVHKLMDSGLAVREKGRYLLRVEKLSALVEELHKDLSESCKHLHEVAEEIDRCI